MKCPECHELLLDLEFVGLVHYPKFTETQCSLKDGYIWSDYNKDGNKFTILDFDVVDSERIQQRIFFLRTMEIEKQKLKFNEKDNSENIENDNLNPVFAENPQKLEIKPTKKEFKKEFLSTFEPFYD